MLAIIIWVCSKFFIRILLELGVVLEQAPKNFLSLLKIKAVIFS